MTVSRLMVQFLAMKTFASTVALLLSLIGCGSPQDSDGQGQDPVRPPGELEASCSDAGVHADSGDAADSRAPVAICCWDEPDGGVQENNCADLCAKVGGNVSGDGRTWSCCYQ